MTALVSERERIVRPRETLIASRLRRFAWRHREAVCALARRHSRLADLALSFPALLFALAVPRPHFDPEPAIERVIAGAPLGELAQAADLPMWTRKLGPEAFLYAIPKLPDGELFRRQIANHLPRRPAFACRWLHYVSQASLWGHEGLALWFAGLAVNGDTRAHAGWTLLCLWAWHCQQPDTPAGRLISSRWTPDMSVGQALVLANDWAKNVFVHLNMDEAPIDDMWATPANVDGFTFEPVRTASELIRKASTMNNCSRDYARTVGYGQSRIWTISKDGYDLAMLELQVTRGCPIPQIVQIHGSTNTGVPPEQWLAAGKWWVEHVDRTYRMRAPRNPHRRPRWIAMWRPYWLAKRSIPPWLPLPHWGLWPPARQEVLY
jgi:hypothetical protein